MLVGIISQVKTFLRLAAYIENAELKFDLLEQEVASATELKNMYEEELSKVQNQPEPRAEQICL